MASSDIQELADLLKQQQGPRKVTFGEYARRAKHPVTGEQWNPFKPNGVAQSTKLKRVVYQNGYTVPEDRISEEDVKILNKLHRPGRYLDRHVELVFFSDEGSDKEAESLDIRYRNKTPDQTIERMRHWVDFSDLCRKLFAEQTERDLKDGIIQEEKVAARREFGSKAYREAVERVKTEGEK